MSARNVIARKLCEQWNDPQSRWRKYLPEADDLLAALAAAGWELHRAGEVVPTSDVLNFAQQVQQRSDEDDGEDPARKHALYFVAAELRALTQQEPR